MHLLVTTTTATLPPPATKTINWLSKNVSLDALSGVVGVPISTSLLSSSVVPVRISSSLVYVHRLVFEASKAPR